MQPSPVRDGNLTAQWEAAGMAGDLQRSDWRGLGSPLGRDLQRGPAPAAVS